MSESSVNPDAPTAALKESQPERHEYGSLVNVGDAAPALGIASDEVEELCEAGALRGHRMRGKFWLVDERSLADWRGPNPAKQPDESPCPAAPCATHFPPP